MTNKAMGFIGGGRVTRIILWGFKKAGKMPAEVIISDTNIEALKRKRQSMLLLAECLNKEKFNI